MKILLLNQTFYPDSVATAQQLADFAARLVEEGHEVSVLTGRRGYDKREVVYSASEEHRGVKIFRVGSTGLGKGSVLRRVVDTLTFDIALCARLLFFPKQDMVVSLTSPPLIGFLGTLFTLLKGGKNIQWLMDINPDAALAVGYVREGSVSARLLTWALNFSLRCADQVIVLDKWMRDVAISHQAKAERVVIMPPWPAHQQPAAENATGRASFRSEHGLEGKFVLLYSGNHSVVHPLQTLLSAAKALRDDPSILFLFIGSGLRVPEVAAFKEAEHLSNIKQLPHQPRERLPDSLASADAHVVVLGPKMSGLVHTSKIYGILATGTPYLVISPRQSHLVDLIKECPGGFAVEHDEVTKLVHTIKQMKSIGAEKAKDMRRLNQNYLMQRCGFEQSFRVFREQILGESASTPAYLPSRA